MGCTSPNQGILQVRRAFARDRGIDGVWDTCRGDVGALWSSPERNSLGRALGSGMEAFEYKHASARTGSSALGTSVCAAGIKR